MYYLQAVLVEERVAANEAAFVKTHDIIAVLGVFGKNPETGGVFAQKQPF